MIIERLQIEFKNGMGEIVSAPIVLLGAAAIESSIKGATIAGLVVASGLVVDGIRRNTKTRLDT